MSPDLSSLVDSSTETGPSMAVIGDVMLDQLVEGVASRLSPEAPVPVLLQQRRVAQPGGAANVAMNLVALGAQVKLYGVVGDDTPAGQLRNLLQDAGVDTSGLLKTRLVARRQQLARVDLEEQQAISRNLAGSLLATLKGHLAGCSWLVVSDYGKGVLTSSLCRELLEFCREAKISVLVDPDPRGCMEKYRGAALLKPNWAEAVLAARLQGDAATDPESIGKALLCQTEAGSLLITRGDQGMILFRPGQSRVDFPATRRDVYDVTGAGDTVMATLAWSLAVGMEIEAATRLANLAGGLAVERFGTARIGRKDLARALDPLAGLREKLIPRDDLHTVLARHREAGRRIVFTNGCFDLLHLGHIALLRQCAALGDVVVVGLNSDSSVRQVKGPPRPIQDQEQRALLLAALPQVTHVVLFHEPTPAELIAEVLPDVLVKGGDYQPDQVIGRNLVESRGGRLEQVPLQDGLSTSAIIRHIQNLPHRKES
ncbi:MAG: PfkB family carbohydrate kinase [Acidobacteriota bacterium]